MLSSNNYPSISRENAKQILLEACKDDNPKLLKSLLDTDYMNLEWLTENPNESLDLIYCPATGINNWPIFSDACRLKKQKIINLLLKHEKARAHLIAFMNTQPNHLVNHSAIYQHLPLQIAIINGHVDVTKLLLKNGANPDIEDDRGNSIFSLACQYKQNTIVTFLLTHLSGKFKDIFKENVFNEDKTHMKAMKEESYEKNWLRKTNKLHQTPFMIAIKNNCREMIEILYKNPLSADIIRHQADASYGESHESLLSYCVRHKLGVSWNALLDHGAFADVQDKYHRTPFWYACENEFNTALNIFTSQSPEKTGRQFNPSWLTDKDVDNQSAFYITCAKGHVAIIKNLLRHAQKYYPSPSPLINQRCTEDNRTPLMAAALAGCLNAVKCLVEYGANVNDVDKKKNTLFSLACCSGDTKTVSYFVKRTNWRLTKNCDDNNGFFLACMHGHQSVVFYLLNDIKTRKIIRDNINTKCENGCTPLIVAIENGHINIAKLLLKYHASPDVADDENASAFFWACSTGMLEIVEYLLNSQTFDLMQLIKTNLFHNNAFFLTCTNGHESVISCLLAHPTSSRIIFDNINTKCENGHTALMDATIQEHTNIVKILLNAGADPYTEDLDKNTFFSEACSNGSLDIIELTWKTFNRAEDRKKLLDHENATGNSPFLRACRYGHLEVVKKLVEWDNTINLTKQNKEGKTAIELAQENKHTLVVEFLEKYEKSQRMDIVSSHASAFFSTRDNDQANKRSRSTPPVEAIDPTSKQPRLG